MKEFSQWPTFPQVYGALTGGWFLAGPLLPLESCVPVLVVSHLLVCVSMVASKLWSSSWHCGQRWQTVRVVMRGGSSQGWQRPSSQMGTAGGATALPVAPWLATSAGPLAFAVDGEFIGGADILIQSEHVMLHMGPQAPLTLRRATGTPAVLFTALQVQPLLCFQLRPRCCACCSLHQRRAE